jgi:hypothetical protein
MCKEWGSSIEKKVEAGYNGLIGLNLLLILHIG